MKRRAILLGVAVVGTVTVIGVARPSGYVTASVPQFESMATELAADGVVLSALAPGETMKSALPASVDHRVAVEAAVAAYGKVAQPVVFEGRLTMGDQEPPIDQTPVYAIQLTGLSLAPFGGPASDENLHHELVVFVDARDGKVLLAITVR